MRHHPSRQSSAARYGQQHNTPGGARLPSFWGVCVVILSAATAINLYTFNHRRIQRGHDNTLKARAADGTQETRWVGTKRFAGSIPTIAKKRENAKLDDVKPWIANNAPKEIPDGGARVSSSGPTAVTSPSGAENTGSWAKQIARPPVLVLPLGRDRPVEILVQPQQQQHQASSNAPMVDGSSLQWPGGEEESPTVKNFPCSLTEVDNFLSFHAAGGGVEGGGGKGGGRLVVDQAAKKPWSTEGPCVIACSSPVGEDDVFDDNGGVHLRGGAVDDTGGADGSGRVVHESRYDYCDRAFRACALYQECTHVLLPPEGSLSDTEALAGPRSAGQGAVQAEQQHPPTGKFATLMHRPRQDGSMTNVQAAASAAQAGGKNGGWNGRASDGFTLAVRARTYYVVSFGGSGSKMLSGWLSERGKNSVKEVFHIHDPRPADTLFAKEARKGVVAGRTGRGKDFRGYDFPEGDFPTAGRAVQDIDSYRVVFIFKDPAEALVSRYFYNHCKNLRGADCGSSEKTFPTLGRYAQESDDRLHMETFYDNYCSPGGTGGQRNYPVVCVNYHKMWDNKEALVAALGLPVTEASKLPARTETVRNDQTSATRQEPFTLAMREQLRRKLTSLSGKVFQAPAVAIV